MGWFGKSREVSQPEKGLRDLSPGVIEAALRSCGYEDVVVDAALFQYERDSVFVYIVGTGKTEEEMVSAYCLVTLAEGEIAAVLLTKQVYEKDILPRLEWRVDTG